MSRKRTGNSRYFVAFFTILCLGVSIYWGIRQFFAKIDFFQIEEVIIEGNNQIETAFLQKLTDDYIGRNLYQVSIDEIRFRFDNLVRIENIELKKVIPSKLILKIEERKGVFNLKTTDGILYPMSRDFVILDNDKFYSTDILPIVNTSLRNEDMRVGEKINDDFLNRVWNLYLTITSSYPGFFDQISEIYESENEIFLVEARIGYKIVFGDEDLVDKVKRYEFLEQNRSFEKGKIVDLRFKDQLVIRSDNI
jgi:hypothetical protein